ncbi:MAG: N-acetylmuramoyl-L-alanine amidase [Hespellia sp.]|nr:N-acetylmuramoyl-L-alanine amidase [Hespellia sp.]
MKIQETNLSFGNMTVRNTTNRIIVHHAAAVRCSATDIHRWHKENGWAGAGYHFLVRKDGSVYRLRPERYVGAHASGANADSVGVCFEGDFEIERMNEVQRQAGIELIAELKRKYGISKVQGHRDVNATTCPGRYFPLATFISGSQDVNQGGNAAPAQGSKNSWIARLQAECNAQGFSKQTVDGIYGPKTLAGCPQLRYGASGNITRLMQERLNALGFPCGNADGIFGILTKNAVRNFQSARFLAVDGIVGVNTWRALLTA